jgi:hypothetical protein
MSPPAVPLPVVLVIFIAFVTFAPVAFETTPSRAVVLFATVFGAVVFDPVVVLSPVPFSAPICWPVARELAPIIMPKLAALTMRTVSTKTPKANSASVVDGRGFGSEGMK